MTFHNYGPGFTIALMGLAGLLLAVPATASAAGGDQRTRAEAGRDGDRHRDRDCAEHRDGHRADRGHHQGHGERNFAHSGWFRHWGRSHQARPAVVRHHVQRDRHRHHEASFFCRPCYRRFASRDGFHRHLHHHHRVARHLLSRVIVHQAFGWVFFG